jgi:YggT family protein
MLATYYQVLVVVRYAVFAVAAVTAVIALVDWAVRTRKLNPFGVVARFFRRVVDPVMAPVERRIVRSGGQPQNAPWWTLVVVVVGGLLLIAGLNFAGGWLAQAAFGMQSARGAALVLVTWAFGLLKLALVVRVISSWFQISPWSKWVRWSFILTEWMLAPLRRVIPTPGGLDLTPLIAYFALSLVQWVVLGAA